MSNPEERMKHAERIGQKETKLKKTVRLAKEYGITHVLKEPHKYHKHSPLNCGNPNCVMCMNPRKAFHEKTIQEKSFEQKKLHDEPKPEPNL